MGNLCEKFVTSSARGGQGKAPVNVGVGYLRGVGKERVGNGFP